MRGPCFGRRPVLTVLFAGPQFPLPRPGSEERDKTSPLVDYTPPRYITLLFTDLGILTPAAVSDELLQLYM